MPNNKIFISHSSKDIDFVKPFVEKVLILGLDIPADRIFCSSMEGQGVKSGQYIPERLRDEINFSCLALLFISKNYKSSEVCLNEVGAAWAKLTNETVIPLIMPDADFSEVGFLDLGRLGLKLNDRKGILKLVQDCKPLLNPDFKLEKLSDKIEEYLHEIEKLNPVEQAEAASEEVSEWADCFTNNLYALNEIIRKAIPTQSDGIHKITDIRVQTQIMTDLSKAQFLKDFWYRYARGDYYVERLRRLASGNWLVSGFNWEVKISEMWVCLDSELQYEFVLIHSEKQEPYQIGSDIGGESYHVGVLNDGTIISDNERLNGYSIIGGETLNAHEHGVEPRTRDDKSHWVFLASGYHKAGFNADETIKFCKDLDSGKIAVSEENIYNFFRGLRNHPTVIMFR
ncbi:MAG: toll/interleukin-1 receptor domain-containing protein [Pedobacter sp.]|uniref:toll/interleukin-1 receptor domain-containing protein n=1 Tax=Pedobacter sp. TaxID=1411316 RepID=UPI00356923B7